MKNERVEPFSARWISMWDDLLSTRVAIRSVLEFGVHSNTYETELVFKDKGVGRPIYLVRFKGALGVKKNGGIYVEQYPTPPASFLEDWRDYLHGYLRSKSMDPVFTRRLLEPLHHIAILNACYATDKVILPSSHPVLLLNYGMVFERIASARWTYRSEEFNAGNVLAVLASRFEAFLYQQQCAAAQATLGEVVVSS